MNHSHGDQQAAAVSNVTGRIENITGENISTIQSWQRNRTLLYNITNHYLFNQEKLYAINSLCYCVIIVGKDPEV